MVKAQRSHLIELSLSQYISTGEDSILCVKYVRSATKGGDMPSV